MTSRKSPNRDEIDLAKYPLLRAFLNEEFGPDYRIKLAFHPSDEMIVPSPDVDQQTMDHSLVHYFRAGIASYRAIEQVAVWRFGALDRAASILDFASGFGRLSRLLVRAFRPDAVAVAEINAEAVDFQERMFGVTGFRSTTRPEDFTCDRTFDVVFAGSLFTHLPEPAFRGWVKRLASLLTSRGVLIFSVHNPHSFRLHNPTATAEPGAEFTFSRSTWSRHLSPDDYGNTLTADSFLFRALHEELPSHSATRFPFGLGGFQDLCVVVPESDRSFDSLQLDCGTEGNLEGARAGPDGQLTIFGWAASRSEQWPVEAVQLTIDGREVARVAPTVIRAEVNRYIGAAGIASGWHCTIAAPRGEAILQARAQTGSGYGWSFYVGTVDHARLRAELWALPETTAARGFSPERDLAAQLAALEQRNAALTRLVAHLENERADLRARIGQMTASRFWKTREKWFQLKRALGLTRED